MLIKATQTKSFLLTGLILGMVALVPQAGAASSAAQCLDLFLRGPVTIATKTPFLESEKRVPTRIELELGRKLPSLDPDDLLLREIDATRAENSELANRVRAARDSKKHGHSLLINLTDLPSHMEYFLEGTYRRVVGARGLSHPFVTFKAEGERDLIIQHEGDQFPLLVRWSDSVSTVQRPHLTTEGDRIFLMLELPSAMKSKKELSELNAKYIHGLVSGSGMNKYINSSSSRIMTMAALLHDGKLVFDRPTQKESKEVTELLNADSALRAKVKSLLFVAPTATGKTRVLGDRIIGKISKAKVAADSKKKLTIIMTKTPDLTGELAKTIGDQVATELGSKSFRLLQWGGEFTENMTLPELLKFVDESPVPVLLVTSYPTLAARAKSAGEKAALLKNANGLMIDEAHNAGGVTFEEIMAAAKAQAEIDRASGEPLALDIFGVTASPITREQRTVELFDETFWAGVDAPKAWAKKVVNGTSLKPSHAVLEWIRVLKQYFVASDRGELNAGEPVYYKPEERGFDFSTIFKRGETGTASSVQIERLTKIWPDVEKMIAGHGPGVIHTYPRDAEPVAHALSNLTGKNFISLQKMDATTRARVYEAFRNQTEFNGRKVDAIVGTIREGLDFPRAGWYLSFKKYVRFPENVQGPGRVVRIALNKIPPVIVFFGAEINKIAYETVKELVMARLGRLPRKLNEPRLYTGARKITDGQSIGRAIDDINVALEALVRMRSDISQELGSKDGLNPLKIAELQNALRDIRLSGQNREIASALKAIVAEANSYSFFKGDLQSTWDYCDTMIAQAKKADGSRSRKLGEEDLAILKDAEAMANIRHFRTLYAALGIIPRAILGSMELKPVTVSETSKAVNAFVARNGRAPFAASSQAKSLKALTDLAVSASPDAFWRGLDSDAQKLLSPLIAERSKLTIEQAVSEYFTNFGSLPREGYELIGKNDVTAADRIGARLAEELIEKMKEGSLDIDRLSPELIRALDRSKLFENLVMDLAEAVVRVQAELGSSSGAYIDALKADGLLTYESLMVAGDFKALKIVKAIADKDTQGRSNAAAFRRMFDDVLSGRP